MNPLRALLRRRKAEAEPDWQALVDAVDHAVDIYSAATYGPRLPQRHIVPHRAAAQMMSDYYGNIRNTELLAAVDAELFALDAALAGYWSRDAHFDLEVDPRSSEGLR